MTQKAHPPKYRRQKDRHGVRAFVEVDGRRVYLGKHGSQESHERYARFLAERDTCSGVMAGSSEVTIVELCAAFWEHAQRHYRRPDGTPTWEQSNIRQALRPLTELYGSELVTGFGPRCLKAVRQQIVKSRCRIQVNKQVDRIKRMFRWGVAEELVPATVYNALQAVSGLRRGRTDARESDPVKPVHDDHIEAVRSLVSPQVRAIIDVQLLTAARPGEILGMRPIDIDTSGLVWRFTPRSHKTEHYGHSRIIHIGPKGQQVLAPFMGNRPVDAPMFSPKESVEEFRAERRRNRKSPESCGNRPGTNRKANPERSPGDEFDTNAYRHAIQRACKKAFPAPIGLSDNEVKAWDRDHRWTPHQLRHNAATRLRAEAGIDIAQTILGHRLGSAITEIYAETNVDRAIDVIAKVG